MKRKLKLSLENFQSISNGTLEFQTGLNFIVGQSNSGKSATFRALKACLLNPMGSQRFIKWGSKNSSVLLEYNGNLILWKRTLKETSYIINGEEYLKTGRSNAIELLDNTGFVQVGNILMNIEEELQLPFPYGISGADLFKLFENVFCVSDSAVINKSAKEYESKVKSEIIILNTELNKNKQKLEELYKFREEINLEKLKNIRASLRDKKERLTFLSKDLDIIKLAVTLTSSNVEVALYELKDNYEELFSLKKLKEEIEIIKELHKLKFSSYMTEAISNKYEKVLDLYKLRSEIVKIKSLPNANVVAFDNFLNNLKELKEVKKSVKVLLEIPKLKIEEINFNSKLELLNALKSFKSSLENLRQEGKRKKEELKKVEGVLGILEEKLKSFKICPLCKREM